MEENADSGTGLHLGELREITLLIPGEHFFYLGNTKTVQIFWGLRPQPP